MPTIQAAGLPISVNDRRRVRASGSAHSPAAVVAVVTRIDAAAPTSACPSVRTANDGAIALEKEPATSAALPRISRVRRPSRRAALGTAIAASPAARPATPRSCPAAAGETPKSSATATRTGESAMSADCAAKTLAKRTAAPVGGLVIPASEPAPGWRLVRGR